MDFLEKDLEEIIYNANKEELHKRGLFINGKLFRQLRIGNYGIADLVEVERLSGQLYITVYELKKDKIGISAFLQGLNYVRGIKSYIEKERGKSISVYFQIVLIGKKIDSNSSFCYLPEFLINFDGANFLTNYTYSYSVNGIIFKEESEYDLIDKGF